jgi:low temperature requirement protein LtrA
MNPLRTRMAARDITESHRASSPLELLFDLTFVVAVAQIAIQLATRIADGHPAEAIAPFISVFFAIWWAWNQFTWLASAYDTDDALYRVCTMVQMAGVLVLAAGVPTAFGGDFLYVTIGYLIMRVGLVGTLARAMYEDPDTRAVSRRYLIGIVVVQSGWLFSLLFVPPEWKGIAFIVLATSELLVAPWASRVGDLAWHPHHIAERYGLFTIILLGESVLASTSAVQLGIKAGVTGELVIIALMGLVLLFVIWWLYFSQPAGEGLVRHRGRSYIWGYGHYAIFASLAAIGAGLEVAVESAVHHVEASATLVGYAIAIPLAIVLILIWALHAPLVDEVVIHPVATVVSAVLVLLIPLVAPMVGVAATLTMIVAVAVALLVVTLVSGRRAA